MPKQVFDICIVGSGAGGGTLAAHLAQRGVNVAIVEGGPTVNIRTDFNTHALPFNFPNRHIPIPPVDTPGAAAAGVPAYIDLVVKEDPELQTSFRVGLPRLDTISASKFNGATFLQLTEPQQIETLTALSEATGQDGAFFHALKNLTADGYYTSRIGLMQELGYNGDAVLAAFPQSRIPEH